MTTPVEEILDAAVAEGFLTPLAAAEGPAHSAGVLRFGGLGDPGVAPGPDVASGIPVDLDAETIAVDL